jgi:hypothetical protein
VRHDAERRKLVTLDRRVGEAAEQPPNMFLGSQLRKLAERLGGASELVVAGCRAGGPPLRQLSYRGDGLGAAGQPIGEAGAGAVGRLPEALACRAGQLRAGPRRPRR